jgi:hypothetical protein
MKTLYLVPLIILCSCAKNYTNNSVKTIKIDACLNDLGTKVPLSQYASSIDYIVLQSDSNCYLDRVEYPQRKIQFHDSTLFIADKSHLFLFKYDGAFIRKIGEMGKGPGQYGDIRSFTILPKVHQVIIFSASMRSLFFYDFYGKFLKKSVVDYQPTEVLTLGDDLITLNPRGFRQFANYYTFTHLEDNGKVVDRFLFHQNEKDLDKQGSEIGLDPIGLNYYSNRDSLYYWESIYDTIWQLSPSGEVMPKYFIDYGSMKLPNKYITRKYALLDNEIELYVRLSNFIATQKLFFFNLDNTTHLTRILYDLSNGSCLKIKYDDPTSRFPIFGLYNDLDGGMSYWPIGRVNENTTFSMIYGYELKNKIHENTSKSLREIASNSTQLDNPIIMLVNHKKK